MQHDACGVGFVARTGGDADHDVIRLALTALSRLAHRGAPAALGAVDGAGLLTDIPWPLLTADVRTNRLPGRTRALGMFFVHEDDCRRGIEIVDTELHLLGAQVAWRHVPTNARAVLPLQQSSIPRVLQAIVAFRQGRSQAESCLY